jgi:hypothetical protein
MVWDKLTAIGSIAGALVLLIGSAVVYEMRRRSRENPLAVVVAE